MMFTILISAINARISAEESASILDAALLAGVDYPFGCMEGQCGACKTRLISGEIDPGDHEGLGLSDEEIATGWFLACQARPRSDLEIDLPPRSA